ncbi:ABC transporter permease subunit [Bacteroidota bacterium]
MSANIFVMEFKRILRPTVLWTFFICLFIYIDMVFYKQMIESGVFDQVLGIMNNPFIGNMVKGFGVNPEQLTDSLGFYAIRNTMVTMLMGGIYAVITASSLIAMEEHDKTSEFLLSRPVTRLEIMNAKLLAFQINLFLLNSVSSVIGYISLEIFRMSDYSLYSYIVLCIYTYLLTLIFGSIGLFFSLLMKRGRVFIGAIIGIVLGTYFLEVLSKVTESANFLGYFSPFKYADKDVLKPGYDLDIWNLVFFIAGSLLLTIISYRIFMKKDIIV